MEEHESPLAANVLKLVREAKGEEGDLEARTDCPQGCKVTGLRPPCEHGYMTAAYTLYMEGFRERHPQ